MGLADGGGGDRERKRFKVMGFMGIQAGFGSMGQRWSLRKLWFPKNRRCLHSYWFFSGLFSFYFIYFWIFGFFFLRLLVWGKYALKLMISRCSYHCLSILSPNEKYYILIIIHI